MSGLKSRRSVPLLLLPLAGPQAQGWTRKCKSGHCQCWLRRVIHPLAIGQDRPSRLDPAGEGRSDGGVLHLTRGAKPATRRVADGERMNPQGRVARSRQYQGDVEHQGDEHLESGPGGGSPPLFQPLTAYAARGRIFPAPVREPRTRVWAISGPLDTVHTGQPRTSRSNELPSSADLTTRCNTPSKLVMRAAGYRSCAALCYQPLTASARG